MNPAPTAPAASAPVTQTSQRSPAPTSAAQRRRVSGVVQREVGVHTTTDTERYEQTLTNAGAAPVAQRLTTISVLNGVVQRAGEIPPELVISVTVADYTNEELRDQLDLIRFTLYQSMQSSTDTECLEEEAYRIKVELFNRRCTRSSLTESPGEIPPELLTPLRVLADYTNEELRYRLDRELGTPMIGNWGRP